MRNSLTIIAISAASIALAGCSKSEPTADTAPSEAATTAAADAAGATAIRPGKWDAYDAGGKKVGSTEIRADGTYTDTDPKGTRVSGIVKIVDGKTCFDPSGAAAAECFTDSAVAADGTFTATDSKGAVLTIKPQAQ